MDVMSLLPFLQLIGAGTPQGGGPLLQSPDPRPKAVAPGPAGVPAPQGPVQGGRMALPAGRPPVVQDPYRAAMPGFNLGARPLPAKPLPMPVPGGVDFSFAEKMFDQVFQPLETPTLPAATKRAAPESVDLSPFVEKMEGLRPKDSRRTPEQASGDKWKSQLAAAGQGAMAGTTFGDIVLGASTGFVGEGVEFDESLREEARFFDEEQRMFSMEMEALRLQAEEARVAKQNAVSENDFFNASADEARSLQQIEVTRETAVQNARLAAEKIGAQLDIAQARAAQNNAAASATYQNNRDLREWEDATNLLKSGAFEPMSFSEDGRFMTGQRMNENGEIVIETVPSSPIGQKQLAQEFGLAMGLGNEYQEDLENQSRAQFDPEGLKKQMLMRVLRLGGAKIFDERDAGVEWGIGGDKPLFPTQDAPNEKAFWDVGMQLEDMFTTSNYEAAVQKAEKFADDQVAQGAPAEARNEIMLGYLADTLSPKFGAEERLKASRLFSGDKVLTKGLGYIQ